MMFRLVFELRGADIDLLSPRIDIVVVVVLIDIDGLSLGAYFGSMLFILDAGSAADGDVGGLIAGFVNGCPYFAFAVVL